MAATADDGRNALIIVSHPSSLSFSHALAGRAALTLSEQGPHVDMRDLYAEGFDPVLRIEEADVMTAPAGSVDAQVREHQRLLSAATVLVVVHPNWWGKPPAIAAGWIDRVLAPGVAYRLATREGTPEPLLRVQHLVVLNTSDTPADREAEVFGDPLQLVWQRCVGQYLPSAAFNRRTFGPVGPSSPEQRASWLDDVGALLTHRCLPKGPGSDR